MLRGMVCASEVGVTVEEDVVTTALLGGSTQRRLGQNHRTPELAGVEKGREEKMTYMGLLQVFEYTSEEHLR